ncbi:general odorant-binding protein 56d-like [Anopheles aquasalis]|uniref:Putative odorant binding protein n=1 Tax=Anopheles aquasalis TaxID=42839 RepID=T1DNY9_ANOAQ|nr:general odorant-binding protein 56d-like [Anopheles aquasalis]
MQNLRFVSVAVLLLGITSSMAFFTAEQQEIAKNLADACQKELGVELPADFVTKMRLADPSLDNEVSKCALQCIFAKVGFTDAETGVVNRTVLAQKLSKGNPVEKAEQFADLCANNEGESKCDKAFSLHQCYHKNKSIFN